MRIAITLAFDPETTKSTRAIWQQLAEQGIHVPGITSGYRPHITLSVYETDGPEPYHQVLTPFVSNLSPFPLRLDVLGIFPERGVLFLTPRMSQTLMNVHRTAIEAFGANPIADHLLPDRWMPHCTLAIPAAAEQLTQAVRLCQLNWRAIDATVIGTGLQVIPEGRDRWYMDFPA